MQLCNSLKIRWHCLTQHVCIANGSFPGGEVVRNLPANAGDSRDMGWIPGFGRSSGVGNIAFLPGKFHGQRNRGGCSPWGHTQLDIIEKLSTAGWKLV